MSLAPSRQCSLEADGSCFEVAGSSFWPGESVERPRCLPEDNKYLFIGFETNWSLHFLKRTMHRTFAAADIRWDAFEGSRKGSTHGTCVSDIASG